MFMVESTDVRALNVYVGYVYALFWSSFCWGLLKIVGLINECLKAAFDVDRARAIT
jgi:hypothetical protein